MTQKVYILIQTAAGQARKVAAELRKLDHVIKVDDVTGPYDVIVMAEAKNMDAFGKFVVDRIQSIEGVNRTLSCPVVNL